MLERGVVNTASDHASLDAGRLKEATPSAFLTLYLIASSLVEKILVSAHSCHFGGVYIHHGSHTQTDIFQTIYSNSRRRNVNYNITTLICLLLLLLLLLCCSIKECNIKYHTCVRRVLAEFLMSLCGAPLA